MKVLVAFETFGDTLKEKLDIDALERQASQIESVTATAQTPILNYKSLYDEIASLRKSKGDDAVEVIVAVTGSRTRVEEPLRMAMKEAGLDPNRLVVTNVREQCALVHDDRAESTAKAGSLLKAAVEKAKMLTPLEMKNIQRFNEVLVVGGGVSGIHASLDLAKQGIMVHLVEKEPTIGGMMPLLGKTFPEDTCAICIGGPKMADISNEPNINLMAYSEVEEVIPLPVGYQVRVKKKPRYIDMDKCVACNQCTERCPVEVPNELDGRLSMRKAAYIPYGQAIPRKYVIDAENCLYLTKGSCRLCERVCPNDAVDFSQEEEIVDIYVGSIIVATGFENFDARTQPKFGAQFENVLDQYQLARLLDGEGPTAGELFKPSDGGKPRSVIMIQCVGSRDPEINPWCSRYCCMAAMKHAEDIKLHQGADIDVSILFKDIRAGGKFYEEFYNRVQRLGINFVHGNLEQVARLDDGTFVVQYVNGKGIKSTLTGDMIALSTGMVPSAGTRKLADKLGISVDKFGFFAEVDPKVASVTTKKPGIYICGTCQSPKDIPESVAQASAAATMASLHLMKAVDASKTILKPIVSEENCGRCGICVALCPYEAITMPPEGPVEIDNALCQSCGLCISSCPTRALDNPNYGFDMIDLQSRTILEDRDPSKTNVIGFLCNDCGYNLLDTAGFYGAKYSSGFVPIYVPCMSTVSLRNIMNAIEYGADGVMLIGCVEDRCHYEKGVEHAEGQLKLMERLYGSVGEKVPVRFVKSCGSMLQQFLDTLEGFIEDLEAGEE